MSEWTKEWLMSRYEGEPPAQLFASVAYDMRNRLTGIQGCATLLKERASLTDEEKLTCLETILQNAQDARMIIDAALECVSLYENSDEE